MISPNQKFRRRVNFGYMNIYCDEAGYTGRNLLSKEQPYFVYSALHLSDKEINSIKDIINANYPLQGGEIKGNKMVQSKAGQKAIRLIFEQYSKNARIVFHDKKYALACKVVEYCVEPFLRSNYHFYEIKLNIFIASKLYSAFLEKNNSAESIFDDFENILRGNLSVEESIFGTLEANDPTVEWILKIVNSQRGKLNEELKNDNDKVDLWLIELTTTSLLALLSEWYKFSIDLKVSCDNSRAFLNNPVFENLKELGFNGNRVKILDSEIGFKLDGEILNVDSKENLGIQIADLFSSTVFYCLNSERTDFTRLILSLVYRNSICTPETSCILPEDLDRDEFQMNKEYYAQFMDYIQGNLIGE